MIHKSLIRLHQGNKNVISSPKINGIYTVFAKSIISYCTTALNSESNKALLWHKD